MIEIADRQILIDGEPRMILCGEIHYFRLRRDEWQDRIDKLQAAGCNAVASYIPWLCHEPGEGALRFRRPDAAGARPRRASSICAATTASGSSPGPARS